MLNIYVVKTYSYDPGVCLKAFYTLGDAEVFRNSISSPIENGDDIVYELNSDSFWWVDIETVELV